MSVIFHFAQRELQLPAEHVAPTLRQVLPPGLEAAKCNGIFGDKEENECSAGRLGQCPK